MRRFSRKIFVVLIVLCCLVYGGLEVTARFFGMVDFPLYVKSGAIGYYLKPGQSGAFLDRNHWYVNRAGFNNQIEFRSDHPYAILTGDSVIYGGNPIDYETRIGTLTQRFAGQNIWTAAVGGWSLENELSYLKQRQAAVAGADKLIVQFDNGDLDGLARWGGEMVHPTGAPFSAFSYVLSRDVLPRLFHMHTASDLPPIPTTVAAQTRGAWHKELEDLLSYYHGRVLFLLYPDQQGFENPALWAAQTQIIRAYLAQHADRIDVVDVGHLKGWSSRLYRDSIHPDAEGRELIARAIANWIDAGTISPPRPAVPD